MIHSFSLFPAKKLRPLDFLKRYWFLILILLIFLGLIIQAWKTTWDDSGITLAFSKNLALYGNIVPTLQTLRVEGYSSFLWMIINSFYFWIGLKPAVVLTIAKSMATAFAIINIYCFWRILNLKISSPLYRAVLLILFSINSYTIASGVDGMETSLYALLVILSYSLYFKRNFKNVDNVMFSATTTLLIFIRHEGFLFLIPFWLILLIEKRRSIFKDPVIYIWLVAFLAYHGWHYYYFGEFLTNPMLAKSHWPYRSELDTLSSVAWFYVVPLIDFFLRYICLFILLVLAFFQKNTRGWSRFEKLSDKLILFISIMGIIIMLITGANWGAAARLSYPALPFLLLFITSFFDSEKSLSHTPILFFFVMVSFVFNTLTIYITLTVPLPGLIRLSDVEKRSSSITSFQRSINLPFITVAAVDMGGLLLFHGDGKKIIDLGLLCDKELGKNGYTNLEKYLFIQNSPEIIEAHGFWLEPLMKIRLFQNSYTPVLIVTKRNEQIYYIRNDIVSKLKSLHIMPYASANSGFTDLEPARLDKLGNFLVLDLQNPP